MNENELEEEMRDDTRHSSEENRFWPEQADRQVGLENPRER
jgi:hypothetical protein